MLTPEGRTTERGTAMPDPREVLEREAAEALEAAKQRIRDAVEQATQDVLAELGASVHRELTAAATGGSSTHDNRVTRSDAVRMFKTTTSKLRSLEARGLVHPRRRGGRIMVDPEEVATALGVLMPE